jgi:Transposase domain (DUF772)
MRPKDRRETGQSDLLRSRLDAIIDMGHPLVKLARTIDWPFLEQKFGAVYEDKPGRPPLPTRLMAGLAILKHTYDLSDEVLCERWVENPYYQRRRDGRQRRGVWGGLRRRNNHRTAGRSSAKICLGSGWRTRLDGPRVALGLGGLEGCIVCIALKVRWPSADQRTFLAVQKIAVFTLGSAVRMRAVGCNQNDRSNQLPFMLVLVYDTAKRSGVVQERSLVEHGKALGELQIFDRHD